MSTAVLAAPMKTVVYPESDGKPMADNTKQARWIFVLFGNLSALYREAEVFVAADLFWYAVEGDESARVAPDVMVIFGRPKGDRGSYKQWEEDNVPPAVVFEVLSPSNDFEEMADKLAFYDEHGVQEYYVFNPDKQTLTVYLRGRAALRMIRHKGQHVSERLGIRFDLTGPEMTVYHPDGRRFLSFEELEAERQREAQRADRAEQRAGAAERRIGEAEQRVGEAERRAGEAEQRAVAADQRAARLAELGRRILLGEVSDEDRRELENLTRDTFPPNG